MQIDKSWITKPLNTLEYANGLNKFLEFAFKHKSVNGRVIKCPCSKCGFKKWRTRNIVQKHPTCRPFPKNYQVWHLHGEDSSETEFEVFESTPQNAVQEHITCRHVIEDTFQPQNAMENAIKDANSTLADLQQKFEIMKSQLQVVIDYIIAKEGGIIPKKIAGLFHTSTQQVPDAGSRTSSPNKLKDHQVEATHLANTQSYVNGI